MFDIMWDVFQHRQINDLKDSEAKQASRANNLASKQDSFEQKFRDLDQRHEQLKLVTLSLWAMLKDHNGFKDEDLKRYIEKVDLSDGKLDGKANTKESCDCSGCGRKVLNRSKICVYCGTPVEFKSSFART